MAPKIDIDESLKNAFDIVRTTFSEFGALMLDFEAELKELDSNLFSVHTGNGIVTDASKSLKHAESWVYPFIARYYTFGGEEISNIYAAAGMVHKDSNKLPIKPKFIMGVISNKSSIKKYKSWWLSSMYSSEITKLTEKYSLEDGNENYKWFNTTPNKNDGHWNENWYEEGFYSVINLTEIKNRNTVEKLAKDLNKFYSHVKKRKS